MTLRTLIRWFMLSPKGLDEVVSVRILTRDQENCVTRSRIAPAARVSFSGEIIIEESEIKEEAV